MQSPICNASVNQLYARVTVASRVCVFQYTRGCWLTVRGVRGEEGARVQSDPLALCGRERELYGDKTVSTVAQMAIVDNGEHRRGRWRSDETENRLLMSLRTELNDPRLLRVVHCVM
mgnify:CR=1 FL=1